MTSRMPMQSSSALNAATFTQQANAEASGEEESSNPGFGGTGTAEGLVISEDSPWLIISQIG